MIDQEWHLAFTTELDQPLGFFRIFSDVEDLHREIVFLRVGKHLPAVLAERFYEESEHIQRVSSTVVSGSPGAWARSMSK